mmetsp:Transcript_44815/g.83711  ORF Transcript_44815/g.83711 Transcript_44815/m.83711 type:complete len:387 (-) Transcript_44815:489-1649(-)
MPVILQQSAECLQHIDHCVWQGDDLDSDVSDTASTCSEHSEGTQQAPDVPLTPKSLPLHSYTPSRAATLLECKPQVPEQAVLSSCNAPHDTDRQAKYAMARSLDKLKYAMVPSLESLSTIAPLSLQSLPSLGVLSAESLPILAATDKSSHGDASESTDSWSPSPVPQPSPLDLMTPMKVMPELQLGPSRGMAGPRRDVVLDKSLNLLHEADMALNFDEDSDDDGTELMQQCAQRLMTQRCMQNEHSLDDYMQEFNFTQFSRVGQPHRSGWPLQANPYCQQGAYSQMNAHCHIGVDRSLPPKTEKRGRQLRPCRGKRERYRKLVLRLRQAIEEDPFGFDLYAMELPPSISGNPTALRKLKAMLQGHINKARFERKAGTRSAFRERAQ